MCVHIVGDSRFKLDHVGQLISERMPISSELLGTSCVRGRDIHALIVAADLRDIDNISVLKSLSVDLSRISKRIFLIDQKSRLSIVQAYALGATSVLTNPVNAPKLLAELLTPGIAGSERRADPVSSAKTAAAGAACFAAMFSAILTGSPIDVEAAKSVGRHIADSIAEHGLTDWLTTVRQHHEGTFQHCLLVTGVAVDFGLSLGLSTPDVERLCSAAMFHDIGKAKIPLTILDKPGSLEPCERTLVESHPAIGYDVLKGNKGVSAEILDAVRHHHEYLDGSGYPDGLCAQNIADVVRMLTISDIFAALIEFRSYKPVMPREQAFEILRRMDGKLEKPLVQAFREVALTR